MFGKFVHIIIENTAICIHFQKRKQLIGSTLQLLNT